MFVHAFSKATRNTVNRELEKLKKLRALDLFQPLEEGSAFHRRRSEKHTQNREKEKRIANAQGWQNGGTYHCSSSVVKRH